MITIKKHSLLALVGGTVALAAPVDFDANALKLSCSTAAGEDEITTLLNPLGLETNTLGRSFDGWDWQTPPGSASESAFLKPMYEYGRAHNTGANFERGDHLCQVTLPRTLHVRGDRTTVELDAPYYLT